MTSFPGWLYSWLGVWLLCSSAFAAEVGGGKIFMTVDEALATAFKDCKVERSTQYLSKAESKRIDKLAGGKSEVRLCYPYVAHKNGKLVGTAYFDTHKVRTKRETIMVVVAPDGKVTRLELLAFAEPVDYIPNARWYGQFPGKKLDSKLTLKGSIKGVTGATLTARATTEAVRRLLAIHKVLAERSTPKGGAGPKGKTAEGNDPRSKAPEDGRSHEERSQA